MNPDPQETRQTFEYESASLLPDDFRRQPALAPCRASHSSNLFSPGQQMRWSRLFLVCSLVAIAFIGVTAETPPNFRAMPSLNCEQYEQADWQAACNHERQRRLSVTALSLTGSGQYDGSVMGLGIYPNLASLDLSGSRVTDRGMAALMRNRNLQTLDISGTLITDQSLFYLGRLPGLKIINLNGTRISDAGIRRLSTLSLLSLQIGLSNASAGILEHLVENHPKLRSLGLAGIPVEDTDLLALVGVDSPEAFEDARSKASVNPILLLLGLSSRQLPIENKGLIEIQELDLTGTAIKKDFVWKLSLMSNLRYLNLSRTEITDDSLDDISVLENLEALSLNQTGITDDAMDSIAELDDLRSLSVQYTKITEDSLATFADMDSLQQVYIKGTDISPVAAQKFREDNPDIELIQ